jgi:hypothetical protein
MSLSNRHIYMRADCLSRLFRPDMLELSGRVQEVVGVGLGSKLARVGLLNEVFITLLLSKVNGVLLAFEVDVSSLHEITRRLPAYQRVLPSVSLGENVPIHSPAATAPVTRLRSGLGLLVDANCSGLELNGSA